MSAGMEGGEISFTKPFCIKMNCLISRRKESIMSKKRVKLYIVMAIYFSIWVLFITFPPFLDVIDVIDPHIIGLPCSQFCILLAPVMICIGLITFFIIEGKFENEERANFEEDSGEGGEK